MSEELSRFFFSGGQGSKDAIERMERRLRRKGQLLDA